MSSRNPCGSIAQRPRSGRSLIDFPNVPAWENDVLEVRQTSPGVPAIGTTFVARRLFGGRESLIDCRITGWEDGRSVTMELKGGLISHASVTYAVRGDGRRLVPSHVLDRGADASVAGMGDTVHPGHRATVGPFESRKSRAPGRNVRPSPRRTSPPARVRAVSLLRLRERQAVVLLPAACSSA